MQLPEHGFEVMMMKQNERAGHLAADLRQKLTLVNIGKWLALVAAACNLVLYPIHVQAMLKMADDLCGIVMFLFVLFGLVALFQATRIHGGRDGRLGMGMELAALVLTGAMGVTLYRMYGTAIATQVGITEESILLIRRAMRYTEALLAAYGVSFITLAASLIRGFFRHDDAEA